MSVGDDEIYKLIMKGERDEDYSVYIVIQASVNNLESRPTIFYDADLKPQRLSACISYWGPRSSKASYVMWWYILIPQDRG